MPVRLRCGAVHFTLSIRCELGLVWLAKIFVAHAFALPLVAGLPMVPLLDHGLLYKTREEPHGSFHSYLPIATPLA